MSVSGVDIYKLEQMFIHVMPIRVRIGGEQADIFVQVKRRAERKIKSSFLVLPYQLTINALHGLAGGQTENQVRVGSQIVRHYARDQRRGRFVRWLYDYFH